MGNKILVEMTTEQVERTARIAAELGDTEMEKMCDDALAGITDACLVMDVVRNDERYIGVA